MNSFKMSISGSGPASGRAIASIASILLLFVAVSAMPAAAADSAGGANPAARPPAAKPLAPFVKPDAKKPNKGEGGATRQDKDSFSRRRPGCKYRRNELELLV